MCRYPHEIFSRASRSTLARIDRSVGGRPRRFGREMRMPAGEHFAVPAQHRLGAHQQSHSVQHVAGEMVQQGGQEGAVGGAKRTRWPVRGP
jgi:hypothetical protein